MKIALSVIALLLLVILGPAAWQYAHFDPNQAPPEQNLPWQIEHLPGGETRVFGITPGRTTLGEVTARLGQDGMSLAIVAEPNESGNVEMYYETVTMGFVAGKLIITADLPAATIDAMRERAPKTEYMQSTTRKATLAPADRGAALAAPVRALAFIPSAQLDEAVVQQRFGPPAERLRINDHQEHLLYPAQGLDLMLDSQGRELLQYVAPARFEEVRAPILKLAQSKAPTTPSTGKASGQ